MSYLQLVRAFRTATDHRWPETGLCCRDVDSHGAPRCCYQVVNGAPLQFTSAEIAALVEEQLLPEVSFRKTGDGLWDVNRDVHRPDQIRDWMRDGWIADTLECAAHPLMPALVGHLVASVVAVPDCNTTLALSSYRVDRGYLADLWQTAVDCYGAKPYYPTHGQVRADMVAI